MNKRKESIMASKALRHILLVVVAGFFVLASAPSYAQQRKTHIGGDASALVTLFANVFPNTTQPLERFGSDGNSMGPFELPSKTALVVTDLIVSVNGIPAAGITRGGLRSQSGLTHPGFSFDTTQQGSQTIHLTGGAVWTEAPNAINAFDSKNAVFITVYGYLVSN